MSKWTRWRQHLTDPKRWSSSPPKNWLNKPSTMSHSLRNMWITPNSGMHTTSCNCSFYQQMETVASLMLVNSLSDCRELLVIGGVAAKEQMSALEQGVRDIKHLLHWAVGNNWTLQLVSPCFFVSFLCGLFTTRLISSWEHPADWMISYQLENSVCPKSAF